MYIFSIKCIVWRMAFNRLVILILVSKFLSYLAINHMFKRLTVRISAFSSIMNRIFRASKRHGQRVVTVLVKAFLNSVISIGLKICLTILVTKSSKITDSHVFLIKITDKCVTSNRYLLPHNCSHIKGFI